MTIPNNDTGCQGVLTQKDLKAVLKYDDVRGEFTWRADRPRGAKAGDTAGRLRRKDGYRIIAIDGRQYLAHRLAWLYMRGEFPRYDIDHINRDPADFRYKNLREVTRTHNLMNTGISKNNTSGVKGVHYCKRDNRWKVKISIHRECYWLGRHLDFDEAVAHRLAAEQCLGWGGSPSPACLHMREVLR